MKGDMFKPSHESIQASRSNATCEGLAMSAYRVARAFSPCKSEPRSVSKRDPNAAYGDDPPTLWHGVISVRRAPPCACARGLGSLAGRLTRLRQ